MYSTQVYQTNVEFGNEKTVAYMQIFTLLTCFNCNFMTYTPSSP